MAKRKDEGARANFMPSPPALFRLRLFGEVIHQLTGETAYLVGSILERPHPRDIDVRVMVDDADFDRLFGDNANWVTNPSLTLTNMALSALAKELSGLDIDCQLQRASDANAEYGDRERQPLLLPVRARQGNQS